MGYNNDVLYGVEPYTGKIICHSRTKGSKNGFSFGQLVDAAKVAKGKLLANGKYVYDRASSGQLGSRTINNARNAASNAFNSARTAASNTYDVAKTGVADTLMKNKNRNIQKLGIKIDKTTKRYAQNKKAKEARNKAMTDRGNRWMYENKSLVGKAEKLGRNIRSAINDAGSAVMKGVNKYNNWANTTSNNFNKGIQDWWETTVTGKRYKK